MHFQFPSQRKLGVRRGTKAASNTKPGSRLFSLGTHTYVEDATRETSFGLCITKKRPPTNWIHDGLGRLEFEFWSYLINLVIFDFPLIPIFGTSFWSWKHRFGFDGVGSQRTHMRDTIQKIFPCCQPSRDLRSSRLESLKAKILSNRGRIKSLEMGAIIDASASSATLLNCWRSLVNILNLWWTFALDLSFTFFWSWL